MIFTLFQRILHFKSIPAVGDILPQVENIYERSTTCILEATNQKGVFYSHKNEPVAV